MNPVQSLTVCKIQVWYGASSVSVEVPEGADRYEVADAAREADLDISTDQVSSVQFTDSDGQSTGDVVTDHTKEVRFVPVVKENG